MALPIGFLLGLLVVIAHREVVSVLPGQCTVENIGWSIWVLPVPWLLALLAGRFVRASLVSGRAPLIPPRALLRLSLIGTALSLHAFFSFGAYSDCIDRVFPTSHIGRVVLALLPLYLVELPRIMMATMAEGLLEVSEESDRPRVVMRSLLPTWRDVLPSIRLRFGWPTLVVLPAVMLGGCLDLLQLHRPSYVFVLVTSAGMTIATIAFLILVAMALPYWFRVAFGVVSALPEPTGRVLRETAQALGFKPYRVLLLPTGMRSINAMMVGPLPVGRLLCFTDGLISTLDSSALTGVLAHEVGHARMGHPGLLMMTAVIVPLMVLSPLRLFEVDAIDPTLQALMIVVIMLMFWLGLRTLARRFEHEADVSSVEALGAGPCSRALTMVAQLAMPASRTLRGRLVSLHPDEQQRLKVMSRYEVDPAFRERFRRQTKRLRQVLAGILLAATAIGSWFWVHDWPYERVFVRFYAGDYVGAKEALQVVADAPERWRDSLKRVDEELQAALELDPDGRDWESAQAELLPAAWQRGEQVLLADGPAAARPWLALAVSVMPSPTPTEYAIYEFCRAAEEGDSDTMADLARIIKRRGAPPQLEPVFRDY